MTGCRRLSIGNVGCPSESYKKVSEIAPKPQKCKGPANYSDHLDRAPCELDPLLPAEQMQQHHHALVWTQNGEQSNLLAQRAGDHPHPRTRREAARLRQLDQSVTFARTNLGDDIVGDTRWQLAVHDKTPHACGPPRVPPP